MMRYRPTLIRSLPFPRQTQKSVSLQGPLWLLAKWELWWFWRLMWPRMVIHVDNKEEPYWVYFVAGDFAMRGWWRVCAREIAPRVGPGKVTFYFCRDDGSLLSAKPVGKLLSTQQVRVQYPNALLI